MRKYFALLLLLTTPSFAKRGLTPEDYFKFETLSDLRLSPDARQAAYVVTTVDQKANRRRGVLWLASLDGRTAPRALTTDIGSASAPRWSPDGKTLAFLSTRPAADGKTDRQIWLLPMSGGEPRRLTTLPHGVGACEWSPDSTRLVVTARTGPRDATAPADRKSDVRHYTTLSYKFNDSGWFDDTREHLWIVPVSGAAPQQLTSGQDWNDTDPRWSPDGRRIAFVSDRTGKAFEDSHNTDVWVIPAEGGELTRISDHPFADNSPRWSPDGRSIAFLGAAYERQHPKIWIAPAAGGPARLAVKDLDLIPTQLEWPRARTLYFNTGVRGENQLYEVDLDRQSAAALTRGARAIRFYDINPEAGALVYAADDFRHLPDLYAADLHAAHERKLTTLNSALWEQLDLASVERVQYNSTDGLPIDGFLVKPLHFDPARKYPLILSIHGGPAGQYGVDWYQEFQVYAAHGWAVFFCNPRGSTGYGEKFERGIVHNLGRKDYDDVMSGVDAVLARNPWLDRDRMGVTGGSYGGYLTNWIISHTDRFKAAVTLRSVVNFISDDGTRDGAYGHKDDFEGDIFQRFDEYWEASPLKHAASVHTPTLILHSDNDFRVPLEQGEQWFRALKHFGVTTELVLFPRENHNLTRTGEPKHLVESMNWQLYWFDKYLLGKKDAVAPDA